MQLEYGTVLVTKGKHQGKIGYYDDDTDNRAIVYFGHINAGWEEIKHEYLINVSGETLAEKQFALAENGKK